MKTITITLTVQQAERILESLHSHFAGDTSEGDLTWTQAQHETALRAQARIEAALDGAAAPAEALAGTVNGKSPEDAGDGKEQN